MMTRAFVICCGLLLMCSWQNTFAQSSDSPAADAGAPQASNRGIRFMQITPSPIPKEIYMVINDKRVEKVDVRPAAPGARVPYPKNRVVALYGGLDPKGKPDKDKLLISKELPADSGSKTVGLVGITAAGKLTLEFLNESAVPVGTVYLMNMTNRDYTLNVDNPPNGEDKKIELPRKSVYVFGKNASRVATSQSIPAKLMYNTKLPNGKTVAVKDRGMMLTTYPARKVIMILAPDASGKTLMLSEFMVFPDNMPGAPRS